MTERQQQSPTCFGSDGAHGIDFVHEDDAGRILGSRSFEEVPDPGSPHTHDGLHKVAASHLVEGDAGLACYGLGTQGFAAAGRALQQHALWRAGAECQEALGILEELQGKATHSRRSIPKCPCCLGGVNHFQGLQQP